MFQIVGVPYAEYRDLPRSEHRWLLICLSRYADETGVAFPTNGSLPSIPDFRSPRSADIAPRWRCLACSSAIDRLRPGGRYRYRIAMPLRPRKFGRVSGLKHPVSQAETRVANLPKHLKKKTCDSALLMVCRLISPGNSVSKLSEKAGSGWRFGVRNRISPAISHRHPSCGSLRTGDDRPTARRSEIKCLTTTG